jgi:hypothetical protein
VAQLGRTQVLVGINDVAALPTTTTPPLVLAMTCTMARFELPGYNGLAEQLVGRGDGGAIAVLSSSSLSEHGQATLFLDALLTTLPWAGSATATMRLGDALLAAQSSVADRGPHVLPTYNLLGDPALRVRAPAR